MFRVEGNAWMRFGEGSHLFLIFLSRWFTCRSGLGYVYTHTHTHMDAPKVKTRESFFFFFSLRYS